MSRPTRRPARGFALLELAIVLAIIGVMGLLVWKFLPMVKSLPAVQHLTGTTLEQAEQAVDGFALANGRLPCPDSTGDGVEDCSGSNTGRLPVKTLGIDLPEPVRYGVYRSANADPVQDADLAVLKDRYNPYLPPATSGTDSNLQSVNDNVQPSGGGSPGQMPDLIIESGGNGHTYSQPSVPTSWATPLSLASVGVTPTSHQNGLDLCMGLLNMMDTATASATNLTAGTQNVPIAYGLAIAGSIDADGDGNAFDGLNSQAGRFESGGTAVTAHYDDQTRTVGTGELMAALSCNRRLGDVNAAARATWSTYDIDRFAILYASFRAYDWYVNEGNIQSAEQGLTYATVGLVLATVSELVAIAEAEESDGASIAAVVVTTAGLAVAAYGEAQAIIALNGAYDAMAVSDAKWQPALLFQAQANAEFQNAAVRVESLDSKGILP